MDFVDYYKLLGIDKSATPKEVKNAYRKLARKYHPDLNPNDKDSNRNFQKINEANEVLSDPEKRKKYDRYGKDWQHSDQAESGNNSQEQSSNARRKRYSGTNPEGDFSDFFESMFGGASGAGRSRQVKFRGEDYNAELHLSLEDAITNHKQTLTVNEKKIRITIPAGIENGQIVKIPGHGGSGINGGPNGDLYLKFTIADRSDIKRSGNDLYSKVTLELYTAILGGEITIDTLSGKVKLKVKPETQNGTKIKLKGKGFPVYKNDGQFGDFYITYEVKIPTDLTERQKVLFTELSEIQA
jgi:curved DNA-binding protein